MKWEKKRLMSPWWDFLILLIPYLDIDQSSQALTSIRPLHTKLITWEGEKNTFQQTIPSLLASVGWGLRLCLHGATTRIKHFCCFCIVCVQVGLGCAKDVSAQDGNQKSLIWRKSWFGSPVKWKIEFSNDNVFCCHFLYQKKDSSGIISKNVEWNPALDGTTTARPQVPIAYFSPLLSSLQLNLNNADQVQSQRVLEMDKGNSWWSTPLSSRAWQKKW